MENRVDLSRCNELKIPDGITSVLASGRYQETRPAVAAAFRFAGDADRRYLALAGSPGTGKSVAAAVALLAAKTKSKTLNVIVADDPCFPSPDAWTSKTNGGKYVTRPVAVGAAPMDGRWVQAYTLSQHLYDSKLWDALKATPILVVDDLGAEERGERLEAAVLALLADRGDAALKTVVTTNLSWGAFRDRYSRYGGERFVDRLDQTAWFNVAGGSMRHEEDGR